MALRTQLIGGGRNGGGAKISSTPSRVVFAGRSLLTSINFKKLEQDNKQFEHSFTDHVLPAENTAHGLLVIFRHRLYIFLLTYLLAPTVTTTVTNRKKT